MNRTIRLDLLVVALAWLGSSGMSLAAVPKTDNAALVYYQALIFVDGMPEEARDLLHNPRYLRRYKDDRHTRSLVMATHRWAIQYATIASRMPECDWGLMPVQSPMYKWGPEDLLFDLGLLIRLDVKFSVQEDPVTALERCNTLRRLARQLAKEHQVWFGVTGVMEKMGLEGLIYMVQVLADDEEKLHWLQRQLVRNEFNEISLIRYLKHRRDDAVRHCLTQDEARIMVEQDGHDPNEEPYRSTLSLTDEQWIRFRTAPYVEYMNNLIELLRKDTGYEQTLTAIRSLWKRYDSEMTDRWARYHTDGVYRSGTCYAGFFQTRSQVNVLKNAIRLYLIISDTGQVPDVLPPGMAKDPHTGRDFIYERTPEGFLFRCQAGKFYHQPRHEFVFKVDETMLNKAGNNVLE